MTTPTYTYNSGGQGVPAPVPATGPVYGAGVLPYPNAALVVLPVNMANYFRLSLGVTAQTINAGNGVTGGQVITVELVQDSSGSRTVTWGSMFTFGAAGAQTLSTAANKRDYVQFIWNDATSAWHFLSLVKGF
jgi:hypothetical protein